MFKRLMLIAIAGALIAGCHDDNPVVVRDVTPPAAPRGFYSVTGDHQVYLHWLDNTESDVAGYRIYQGDCASGPSCPYTAVGMTTGNSFTVSGLANGVTKYYAVAAYDRAGNESDLSYEDVFDTPRPEGFDAQLTNFVDQPAAAGWDFSAYSVRPSGDPATDMYFGYNGTTYLMFVPDYGTDIQDAGYASTLDAVDFAPISGWSPTGTVELIEGHCYVVWTRDDHYAKFQVTSITPPGPATPARVRFDWAYQVDPGNRELRNRPVKGTGPRPVTWEKPPA
jgi:hypothetical protein